MPGENIFSLFEIIFILKYNVDDSFINSSRLIIGGAAVTEEIVPGYKFSRASYVLSLLRPQIFQELELKRHGLKVSLRA